MKTYILGLGLFLSAQLLAQNGQLENPGFENWSENIASENPQQWFTSNGYNEGESANVKSSDAQSGSFSIECRATNPGQPSYFGLGEFDGAPAGGFPYTADFTTVKFWYKSDFQPGDSLYIYIIRYLGGFEIGEYVGGVVSGTQAEWTEASFEIPSLTQDHVFLAFATASPTGNGDNNSIGSWFRIDNVRLFDGNTERPAVPNFSLENWQTFYAEDPDSWYSLNKVIAPEGIATTVKTTDAHTGSFAAELKSVYSSLYDSNIPGILTLTDLSSSNAFGPIPYVAMPASLSGWYKYSVTGSNEEDPYLEVTFYTGDGQEFLYQYDFDPATAYTQFVLPFDLTEQPDSVSMTIFSGDNEGANLKIDDLNFSGGTVGLGEFAKSSLSVYPNPATDKVLIRAEGSYDWKILTLSGSTVLSGTAVSGAQEINVENLDAGTYLVRTSGDTINETHKLVIR